MKIRSIIGSESHTTSCYWASLSMNGSKLTHREAASKEWLSNYGDKHASWCECYFDIPDGATLEWESGSNTGNRGANRTRINRTYRTDASAEVVIVDGCGQGTLEGRLVLVGDKNAEDSERHESMRDQL